MRNRNILIILILSIVGLLFAGYKIGEYYGDKRATAKAYTDDAIGDAIKFAYDSGYSDAKDKYYPVIMDSISSLIDQSQKIKSLEKKIIELQFKNININPLDIKETKNPK